MSVCDLSAKIFGVSDGLAKNIEGLRHTNAVYWLRTLIQILYVGILLKNTQTILLNSECYMRKLNYACVYILAGFSCGNLYAQTNTSAENALVDEDLYSCLFDFAQEYGGGVVLSGGGITNRQGSYIYRFYEITKNYLAVSTDNNEVVFYAPEVSDELISYGDVDYWLDQSNCEKADVAIQRLLKDFSSEYGLKVDETDEYKSVKGQIESYFVDKPEIFSNYNEAIRKTTYLSLSSFSYDEVAVTLDLPKDTRPPKMGIGYSGKTEIIDGTTYIPLNTWSSRCLDCGSAYLISYKNDTLHDLIYKPIEGGGNNAHIIRNKDGSFSAVFVGHDEAEAFVLPRDSGQSVKDALGEYWFVAPTYSYHLQDKSWSKSDFLVGGHSVSVLDIDDDGDEDIVVGMSQKGMGVLENKGSGLEFFSIGTGGWGTFIKEGFVEAIDGWSVAASKNLSTSELEIFVGDSLWSSEWEYGQNVILTFSELRADNQDDAKQQVKNITVMPEGYFEGEEYDFTDTNFSDQKKDKSHDVDAIFVDIDSDGDNDVINLAHIWDDNNPYGIIQIMVNKEGEYYDETDTRLHNHLKLNQYHQIKAVDVNGDGHLDLLLNDTGTLWKFHNWTIDGRYLNGSELLLNDGAGNFVTVARHQILHDTSKPSPGAQYYEQSGIPWISPEGLLRWTLMKAQRYPQDVDSTVEIYTTKLNNRISTGPNGADPSRYGEPNFNEIYYLLNNSDVVDMVAGGKYLNGLHHYLSVGKSEGRKAYSGL